MVRIITFALTLFALSFSGCSVFEVKDPNAPDGIGADDPLYLSDIFRAVNLSADYMDYGDYFTAGVVFEDHMMHQTHGRGNVVAMLDRLRIMVSHVEWEIDNANVIKRFDGNRWTINDVPYTVYSGGRESCKGTADFQIVMEPDWKISNWKDKPDVGYPPFFERY